MSIKLGSNNITSARVGSTLVSSIYLGSSKIWPAPPTVFGPTLLLHYDGINNSTTFIDSSINQLTVTANGDASISTSQSKFGGSSLKLDTPFSYLSITDPSAFAFGTGDFTMETWFYVESYDNNKNVYSYFWDMGTDNYGQCQIANNFYGYTGPVFVIPATAQVIYDVNQTSPPAANTWHHLAVVRHNGITTLYLNGIAIGSGADTTNYNSNIISIGDNGVHTDPYATFFGYFDDFRIVKGVAVYTSNFAPPSLPHGAVESLLLLHFDGSNGSTTFIDSSPNDLTVTNNGGAEISTSKSKFGGSSLALNGSNSYLSGTLTTFDSSADFTIEGWVYLNQVASTQCIIEIGNISPEGSGGLNIYYHTDNGGGIFIGDAIGIALGSQPVPAEQWIHFALVRHIGVNTLYLNGVASATGTFNFLNQNNTFSIGSAPNYGQYLDGYIDEFRIIQGYAAYTSNFNPPSLPYASESLLLHFDGTNGSTTFTDSSPNTLTVTANGNATISTTQSKFGGSSAYFDGISGTNIEVSNNALFGFGTNDFTLEAWLYPTSLFGKPTVFSVGSYTNGLLVRLTGEDSLYINGDYYSWTDGTLIPVNQWSHFAVVRQGEVIKIYVNGVLQFSDTIITNDMGSSRNFMIGAPTHDPTGDLFEGYIDEVRIVKGAAVYTNNFDPPTSPF